MDTDDLIRTLAADNDTQERSVGHLLLAGLVLAVPVSTLLFLTNLGVRPDVMTAMRNPLFDLKFMVTIALAAGAIAISLHLSRPEASLGRWAWLLAIPVGLLGIGMMGE
ncbi:MAG: NrsF family protein, partial [Afipia sp.]